MNARYTLLLPCSLLLLASCSSTKKEQQDDAKTRMAMMERAKAAQQLGNPLLPNGGDPNAVNYNVSTSEELEKIDNGAEGEVYFTDPDNPDADIEGITEAFESKRHGNGWMGDYMAARRFARQENRPLLIWFHDSVLSPRSGELGEHLLDSPDFNAWCKDRVVRIKFDSGVAIDDKTRDGAKYGIDTIRRYAKQYGLTKRPALAIVSPRGELIMGIDGYTGFLQETESQIKEGIQRCEQEILEQRAKLAAKGYREWHAAKNDAKVFAKIQRIDDEHGRVYLKKEGGRISRTKIANLAQEDRDFIEQYRKDHPKKKKPAQQP
ncbi:MAG: hypothetical protein MJ058_01685 [Akkermansia sp.]|nr:hypothetical protein [Akkermansia sp.]